MTTLAYQLSEIATLLETRLGETDEMARAARGIQQSFVILARKVHHHVGHAADNSPLASKSQSA